MMFKRSIERFVRLLLVLSLFSSMIIITPQTKVLASVSDSVFTNFVTAQGDKLMDGDQVLRFIGYCAQKLEYTDAGQIMNDWEIEDAIKTLKQMGTTVTRKHVFTFHKADDTTQRRHVMGPGVYDEYMWRAFDKALELCNREGVRLIVPLIDSHAEYNGGVDTVAQYRGKGYLEFFHDPQLRQDFKDFINYVLNRTNVYTGVKYKDDKAILAWETGNELRDSTREWKQDITAYIKSIDPNHLILDGDDWSFEDVVNNPEDYPNIDMVQNHMYDVNDPAGSVVDLDYAGKTRYAMEVCKGKKPFIIGEFGFLPTDQLKALLDEVMVNGTSGALLWTFRSHKSIGGFFYHNEKKVDGIQYRSYNWPGFSSNSIPGEEDEINKMQLMYEYAHKIKGLEAPPIPVPEPPVLLAVDTSNNVAKINWMGSIGARTYDIQESSDGTNWTSAAGTITQNGTAWIDATPGAVEDYRQNNKVPLFKDSSVSRYYRVIAKNPAGEVSAPSNIIDTSLSISEQNNGLAGLIPTPVPAAEVTAPPIPDIIPIADPVKAQNYLIEDFEGYSGSDRNAKLAWKQGQGDDMTVRLVSSEKGSGNYAGEISTEFGPYGLNGYGRIAKYQNIRSFYGTTGIQFWLKPDGSGSKINFRFVEKSGEQWEYPYYLTGTEPRVVRIPFSDFKNTANSKPKYGYGVMNLGEIMDFQIFINRGIGGNTRKSFLLDDLKLYNDNTAEVAVSGEDNVYVPANGSTTAQYTAAVKDQNGVEMDSKTVSWTVYGAPEGVNIENGIGNTGLLTVSSTAAVGSKFDIRASVSETVYAVKNVTLIAIPVESITLDKSSISLKIGKSETVTAAVLPADATYKTLTWMSDNTSVATVSSTGAVTAVGVGTAKIRAADITGSVLSNECTVTVLSNDASLKSLILSEGTLEPVFSPEITDYKANVNTYVSKVDIIPTAASTACKSIKINDVTVTSGRNYTDKLKIGDNVFSIVITAEDDTIKTYTVTVTRQLGWELHQPEVK